MKIKIDHNQWRDWLEVKGLAPKTMEEYNSYFEKIDFNNFNQETVIKFLQKYNNTVARATLKNVIQYLKMMKYSIDVQIPKVTGRKRKRLIEVMKEEEVLELANNMQTERSQLMVLISFYGGLRISELVGTDYGVKPYSFNWNSWIKDPNKKGILKIVGKGNKERKVFIPQKVMARLYQYIKNYVSKSQSREQNIFNIGERRWKQILSKESIKILGRHINPHLFRHSCNQWLRSRGWDVKERQRYLGHENPATTMIYDHTNQDDLSKKFDEIV